jgi:hypothetical protein
LALHLAVLPDDEKAEFLETLASLPANDHDKLGRIR